MTGSSLPRRRFLVGVSALGASALLTRCGLATGDGSMRLRRPAHLRPRRGVPAAPDQPVGLVPLDQHRDAVLFVPAAYRPDTPLPLIVMLHGAGGTAEGGLIPFLDRADAAGLILLAPASRGRTWQTAGRVGESDAAFVGQALADTTARYAVDPGRVAVAGFSDGASYALGIGLANGDLFGEAIAFSPGFNPAAQSQRLGRPRVFVSHGVSDDVLPIDRCSRRIVPALRAHGYDVRYEEFAGGHEIPPDISSAALAWLAS